MGVTDFCEMGIFSKGPIPNDSDKNICAMCNNLKVCEEITKDDYKAFD